MYSWIIRHWKLIAVTVTMVAIYLGASIHGHIQYHAGYSAGVASIQKKLDEIVKAQQNALTSAEKEFLIFRQEQTKKDDARFAELKKIVEAPVYSNECVDAMGLRILNGAIQDGKSSIPLNRSLRYATPYQ